MSGAVDAKVIQDFGDEWNRYHQADVPDHELEALYRLYFRRFPFSNLSKESIGFDMGCGSGRWAKYVSKAVGHLTCIDPSSAIHIAEHNLQDSPNISFLKESVYQCSLQPSSQDFGYSLGVLHHLSDPQLALNKCTDLLKPGAPFLLYLYYDLHDKPRHLSILWKFSNIARFLISRLPYPLRSLFTDFIALTVYLPLASLSKLLIHFQLPTNHIPLSFYSHLSFDTMRTDARDRFGTLIERRYSRSQIEQMCLASGLTDVTFNDWAPFWVCLAYKSRR